jgi:pimeloyl-ACP methyl ester carboxylesterase
MPKTTVHGVQINYEIIGENGPWVALSPGGRRAGTELAPLAERVAAAGFRVLLHDRRNCGASDVVIGGDESEYDIWADDLYELLTQLDALPAYVGGSSSGSRLAMFLALRHPEAVSGLMLWRVTGGRFGAERLAQTYYGQFIDEASYGGMPAVCETEFFRERIEANPSNRDCLLSMDPQRFIDVMDRWRSYFLKGADMPVIGADEAMLRSIKAPVCVIPGNDLTHPPSVGENLSRILPSAELHILKPEQMQVDVSPPWDDIEEELASVLVGFLKKTAASPVR